MFGGGIGFQEVVVILVVAVVLFGRRLPNVARSMGQSYQQFRKGLSDLQATIKIDDDDSHSSSNYSPSQSYTGLPDYSDSYDIEEDGPDFGPPMDNVATDEEAPGVEESTLSNEDSTTPQSTDESQTMP